MAQQKQRAGIPYVMERLRGVRHRGLLLGGLVVLVLVVGGVVLAGSLWAGGETFAIARGSAGATIETVPAVADEGDEENVAAADALEDADQGDDAGPVVVDVDGAVAHPGVYELRANARVADAIDAAGGLVSDADTTSINQAARVGDGEKVYVPREGEEGTPATGVSSNSDTDAGSGGGGATGTASSGLININTATLTELDELPGVGPATAQAIIDEREAHGAFSTPEDIMRVSGIGEKKFEKLATLICV